MMLHVDDMSDMELIKSKKDTEGGAHARSYIGMTGINNLITNYQNT